MNTITYVAVLGILLVGYLLVDICGEETKEISRRILLEDNYYSIISKLDALTKEVDILKAKCKSNAVREVAFTARLTKTVTGHAHFINYDNVSLNIGNAYNPNHGNFVAPVNGTYQFTLYACSFGGHGINLILFVNQEAKGTLYAADYRWVSCASEVFLTSLIAGDDVYVKQHDTNGYDLYVHIDTGFPSFSGVLLYTH